MSGDVVERLRTVSNMINMGEKIRWGEETALMDEAASVIASQAAEIERLTRNTERFPDLMARIVELKDQPLPARIEALRAALGALPEQIHKYQWEADEKQYFGDKTVRSVAGNNGQGMGRQAIAAIPSHLKGVPEFIAAANPDTIAMLLSELLSEAARAETAERLLAEARAALEWSARLFDGIRSAVETNQVVDKDVHGTAISGRDAARISARTLTNGGENGR